MDDLPTKKMEFKCGMVKNKIKINCDGKIEGIDDIKINFELN